MGSCAAAHGKVRMPALEWKTLIRLIPKLSKKKSVVVFFDEFQALLDLPDAEQFLGALRAEIQTQSNVQYIFGGSHQNRLVEIFYAQRRSVAGN